MTGRKIVAVVLGLLGVLVGVALIAAATTILTGDLDEDGFYVSDEHTFDRTSHAIVSDDLDILTDAPAWLIDRVTDPVDIRLQGTNAVGEGLFMGIGTTADVYAYLSGVSYDEVTDVDFDNLTVADVTYLAHGGTAVPNAPADETFWVASTDGVGLQTVDWSLESGSWTAVVMNSDASSGITADLAFGAKISNLMAMAWIIMALGLASLLGGGYLMYRGLRSRRRDEVGTRYVDLRAEASPNEPRPFEEARG